MPITLTSSSPSSRVWTCSTKNTSVCASIRNLESSAFAGLLNLAIFGNPGRDVIHVYFVHIHVRNREPGQRMFATSASFGAGKSRGPTEQLCTPSLWGRRRLPTRMYYASPCLRSSEMEVEGSKCPRRNRMCPPPLSGRHTEKVLPATTMPFLRTVWSSVVAQALLPVRDAGNASVRGTAKSGCATHWKRSAARRSRN